MLVCALIYFVSVAENEGEEEEERSVATDSRRASEAELASCTSDEVLHAEDVEDTHHIDVLHAGNVEDTHQIDVPDDTGMHFL